MHSVAPSPITFGPAWSRIHDGLGDYEEPDEWSESRTRARTLFFSAIAEHAPEVLEDLRTVPLKAYGEAWEAGFDQAAIELYDEEAPRISEAWSDALRSWWYLDSLVRGLDERVAPSEVPAELARLHNVLDCCIACYGLTPYWCRGKAMLMLALWRGDAAGELPTIDIWSDFTAYLAQPSHHQYEERVTFACAGWNPLVETRAQGRRRMMVEIERALDDHLEVKEIEARALGQRRIPHKMTEHFFWLVRYQVQGRSFQRIADEVHRDRKTVEAAIKETAHLVGLQLRPPAKGGRPRKRAA